MNLSALNNAEFLRYAQAQHDTLTSTAVETELLQRFEALLDEHNSELYARVAEYGHTPNELGDILDSVAANALTPSLLAELCEAIVGTHDNSIKLLQALVDAGIDTPESLKARLDLADKFRAVLNDAGDVFSRLTTLTIATTQE